MTTIKTDSALHLEALELGWSGSRKGDPPLNEVTGRYLYNPETGAITGPSGKVLKEQHSKRRDSWRVGVFAVDRVHMVNVGRLGFALQHGRWPVGLRYRNGDCADNSAFNLVEAPSPEMVKARRKGSFQNKKGWLHIAYVDPVKDWKDILEKAYPYGRRGAIYRGKPVDQILEALGRALKSKRLTVRERQKLERAQERFSAIASRLAALCDFQTGMVTQKPCGPSVGKVHRVKTKGPSKAIRNAASSRKRGRA